MTDLPTAPRPYDLEKLNFEQKRKRLRRHLFLFLSPLIIILLLIGVKLASMVIVQAMAHASYTSGGFTTAASRYKINHIANLVEGYKAPFATGTSYLRQNDFEAAIPVLEAAMTYSIDDSHDCQVRVNLVLALIGRADQLVIDKKYQDAIVLYDKAKSVVEARDCGIKIEQSKSGDSGDGDKEADQKLQKLQKDAEQKQQNAKKESNGDKTNDNTATQNDQSQSNQPSQDQLQKLQEQNKTAQEKSNKTRESISDSQSSQQSMNSRDYNAPNW